MNNKHATNEEIEAFLKAFKERAKLFDLVYVDDKPNNIDTLNMTYGFLEKTLKGKRCISKSISTQN